MKGVNSRYCFKNMTERLVDKHIEEIRKLHPEVFVRAEEGEVLPRESVPKKPSKPRPTDSLTGKEVITQSSKRPLIVKPPLGTTPMELSKHRADTHTRITHGVSNAIAHATGALDGVIDGTINGIGELIEDGAFFVSKTYHGVRHGWSRGKYQSGQDK